MPDDIFERASRAAAREGVSRSEFISRAVREHLVRAEAQSLSGQIDAALSLIDSDARGRDNRAATAVAAGRRLLDQDGW